MRMLVSALVAVAALVGCGNEEPAPVSADLPTSHGELEGLCPVPEASRDWNEKHTTEARRKTEALIREVRRNPDGEVELVSADAHTGEEYRDRMSVRELAKEHLKSPGTRAATCARSLIAELQAAIDGRPPPRGVEDERVYLIAEVVEALELRKDGAVYHGPHGCEIDFIYASRSELEPVLGEGAEGNRELITDPAQTVGVDVFRPTAACRRALERRLAALAR
jgi:hypothetical protein